MSNALAIPQGPVQTASQQMQAAVQHHQAGRLQQADAIYRQVLRGTPNHADALHLSGLVAQQLGKNEIAVELISKAIKAKPSEPILYSNLGNALQAQGKLDEAVASYRQALLIKPGFAQAHYNLGTAFEAQGKLDEAIARYHQVLSIKPDYLEAQYNLGNALLAQGKLDEAVVSYRQALSIKPDFAEAFSNLGNALRAQDKLDESVVSLRRALLIKPDFAEAHSNLGITLQAQGKLDEAVVSYRQALLIKPEYAEAHSNLGSALQAQGKLGEAIASYRQALLIKPEYAEAHSNLGSALQTQGNLDEAVSSYRQALLIKPDYAGAHSNLLLTLRYSPAYTASTIFAEHLRFAEQFETPLRPFWPMHDNVRDPTKRLKVGYVSGDFRNHAVAYFIEPILANHDKSQVEVFCYYNNTLRDSITDRIDAAADHWIPCAMLSDEQLAERIRNERIDILVDLSGHTAGNRLTVFARKPAPVQVTWVGYPGTTGLAAMDYRLTDEHLDPAGVSDQYHSEALLRLPHSATFKPAPESPPVNALPALTSEQFTLACLNNLAKINQDAIRLWARILIELPRARMMFGNAAHEQTQQRLIGMFAQEGIAAERLMLQPTMSLSDYLTLHHQIDLALDPFPYGGGTTTCHSLWMGVPVITLAGNDTVSRVGVAIMTGIGLTEFVTASKAEYFERAVALAQDLPRLDRIRQSLRERMAAQSSADPLQLTRSLERVYREIWEKWCAQS